jgi:hypothetical protein
MKILKNLYPFLFALSPALFLYAFNIEEVDAGVILVPIAVSLALTALIWLAARALVRDRLKAGLIAFLAAFAVFSFGHFLNLVRETLFKNPKLSFLIPLVVWILLFVGLGALALRTRRDLGPLVTILSTFVLLLVVLSLVQIGFFHLRTLHREAREASLPAEIKALKAGAPPRDQLPDIYYLIFDRYGNQEILKAYLGYDNSSFADFLSRKGFYVASESHCNYPGTFLSLTSSLNMDYLNGLVVDGAVHKQVILDMLRDFKVWRLLKPLGYRYLHLGSWYEPTQSNPNADLNFGGSGLLGFNREFLLKFIEETVFNPLAKESLMFPKARQSVLEKFDLLTRIPEMAGPKFVFMHMLLPHHPFVFAPDGSVPNRKIAAARSQGEKYVDQVIFANSKIMETVGAILAKSKRPPIIILQADEGPGDEEKPEIFLQSVGSKERMVLTTRIRCGILNAYYLPGVDTSALYPTITPVNTFRLVFNLYFGGHYPLLEDKTYHASQDKATVLDFRLVPDSQLAVPAAKRP